MTYKLDIIYKFMSVCINLNIQLQRVTIKLYLKRFCIYNTDYHWIIYTAESYIDFTEKKKIESKSKKNKQKQKIESKSKQLWQAKKCLNWKCIKQTLRNTL